MSRAISQLVEARRLGSLSTGRFTSNISSLMGDDLIGGVVKLEYNRGVVPTDDFELDVDIRSNRLVLYNVSGKIFLYDVAPRALHESYAIAKTVAVKNVTSIIPPTIRWGLDCSYFTISGAGHDFVLYDAFRFEEVEDLSAPSHHVHCHEMHPSTPGLLAAGTFGAMRLIDLRSGLNDEIVVRNESERVPQRMGVVTCVSWNRDDEFSLVCTSGKTNFLFDTRNNRKPLVAFNFRMRHGIVEYPCTKFISRYGIASAQCPRFLGFYDVLSGTQTYIEPSKLKGVSSFGSWVQLARPSQSFDVDRAGQHIYLGHGNEVVVYDMKRGKIVTFLKGHLFEVMKVKFNELSKELFTFASHFQANVWSPKIYSPLT